MPLRVGESFLQAEARRKREDKAKLDLGPPTPTRLHAGESFLQAEARRKREDADAKAARRRNAEAEFFSAPRSIFVPPAFTKKPPKPPPKMLMPGTRYTGPPTKPPSRGECGSPSLSVF